jgi:putative toxin-antitoxin system antitoxin component (TIGR02293 family)
MESIASIGRFMGGKQVIGSPQSEHDLIAVIRKGLPSSAIAAITKSSDMSEDAIYQSLRIAKRTVARRKASSARLKATESELLYRFARVMVTAAEVLGDMEKSKAWLLADNTALNGERPIDLLDTGIGFENVMDVLRRVEFGVYS